MILIDGKKIAKEIQEEIKTALTKYTKRQPCLAVILVGNHPASRIYVNRKTQACASIGVLSIKQELPENISENELLKEIEALNQNPTVDGILVQLPLPSHINPSKVTLSIDPEKDVDGFHPMNMGKLLIGGHPSFLPCTPLGIKVLLERYQIEVAGKHVLILGRSNIVGKPMAAMLMQSTPGGNATVTVAHRFSTNVPVLCKMADLIVVAIGQPQFIKADMIKEGVAIIDVGINKIDSPTEPNGYKIVGDVDFENVKDLCSFITPVPGGVGPMTIAMLLSNTVQSFIRTQVCPKRFLSSSS